MPRAPASSISSAQQQQKQPHTRTRIRALLSDDSLRAAAAAQWNQHRKGTAGLEVLQRCQALTAFVRTGLLGEVPASDEDTQLAAAGQEEASAAAQPAGGARPAAVHSALSERITAKESDALWLLLEDDADADDAGQASGTPAMACPGEAASGGAPVAAAAAAAATGMPGTCVDDDDDDALGDVIGLLNAPGPAAAVQPAPQQQPVPPQLPRPACASPPPRAACREAHRQSWVQPVQQQQPALLDAASKHASISRAWAGYFAVWAPHAAVVIQARWRAFTARRRFLQLRQAALVVQACTRGWQLRRSDANPVQQQQGRRQQQQEEEQQQPALPSELEDSSEAAAPPAREEARPAAATNALTPQGSSSSGVGSSVSEHGTAAGCCSSSSTSSSWSCSSIGGSSTRGDEVDCGCAAPAASALPQLPELVIRCAADLRTAAAADQDTTGTGCQARLAIELMARAAELGVRAARRTDSLEARAKMASSARELSDAMEAVKGGL